MRPNPQHGHFILSHQRTKGPCHLWRWQTELPRRNKQDVVHVKCLGKNTSRAIPTENGGPIHRPRLKWEASTGPRAPQPRRPGGRQSLWRFCGSLAFTVFSPCTLYPPCPVVEFYPRTFATKGHRAMAEGSAPKCWGLKNPSNNRWQYWTVRGRARELGAPARKGKSHFTPKIKPQIGKDSERCVCVLNVSG